MVVGAVLSEFFFFFTSLVGGEGREGLEGGETRKEVGWADLFFFCGM